MDEEILRCDDCIHYYPKLGCEIFGSAVLPQVRRCAQFEGFYSLEFKREFRRSVKSVKELEFVPRHCL